jgi:uncharacterized coiled-coil protein SlyX
MKLHLPQFHWPWPSYPEADRYLKRMSRAEPEPEPSPIPAPSGQRRPLNPDPRLQTLPDKRSRDALRSASEQARESSSRAMPKEPLVVGNWPPRSLEQRVTALEKRLDKVVLGLSDYDRILDRRVHALEAARGNQWKLLERLEKEVWDQHDRMHDLEAATPSPPTEKATTIPPWDVQELGSTQVLTQRSSPSVPQTTTGGPVAPDFVCVEPTDVSP